MEESQGNGFIVPQEQSPSFFVVVVFFSESVESKQKLMLKESLIGPGQEKSPELYSKVATDKMHPILNSMEWSKTRTIS